MSLSPTQCTKQYTHNLNATLNSELKNRAEAANIDVIDTSTAWTDNEASQFTVDGAHPNPAGAWKLVRVWSNQARQLNI